MKPLVREVLAGKADGQQVLASFEALWNSPGNSGARRALRRSHEPVQATMIVGWRDYMDSLAAPSTLKR